MKKQTLEFGDTPKHDHSCSQQPSEFHIPFFYWLYLPQSMKPTQNLLHALFLKLIRLLLYNMLGKWDW